MKRGKVAGGLWSESLKCLQEEWVVNRLNDTEEWGVNYFNDIEYWGVNHFNVAGILGSESFNCRVKSVT